MPYICDRCGYTTTTTQSFKRHLLKKNICPSTQCDADIKQLYNKYFPIIETNYKCEMCDKYFASRQSKYRHLQSCANTNKSLQRKIADLESQLKEATSTTTTINNTTNNNITNNYTTNHIHVHAFGKEDISYMLECPEKYIIGVMKKGEQGLLQLITDAYFHEEHPENHTIKKHVKNDKIVICFNGEEWVPRIHTDAMDMMFIKITDTVNQGLKKINNSKKILKKHAESYEKFKLKVAEPLGCRLEWDDDEDNYCDDNNQVIFLENGLTKADYDDILKQKKNLYALTNQMLYDKTKHITTHTIDISH